MATRRSTRRGPGTHVLGSRPVVKQLASHYTPTPRWQSIETGWGMMYGRSIEDWKILKESGTQFLIEQARQRRFTSYTELNAVLARRTNLRSFDFDRASERAGIGYLLGESVAGSMTSADVMLSAMVIYLRENDAGPGFYKLAETLGLLAPRSGADAKLVF
jgi:hypothetical protein